MNQSTESVKLPPPRRIGAMSVEEAIRHRRTVRTGSGGPITVGQLSQLLWAAQGVTGPAGLRAAPSAGAQYPLRVYVAGGAILELPVGLYSYDSTAHALEAISSEDVRPALGVSAIGDQPWVRDAAAIIVITADLQSIEAHFASQPPRGERGARYAYIETGAVAENVHLQATVLGLGMVFVGGFEDEAARTALSAPPETIPTALLCLVTG